jgi:hypothetical protein
MIRLAPLRQGILHLQMNDEFYHGVKGVGHLSLSQTRQDAARIYLFVPTLI